MDTKQSYYELMSARLAQLEASINLGKAKIAHHAAEAEQAAHETVEHGKEELRVQREKLQAKLEELKGAAESHWHKLRDEVDGAWQALSSRHPDSSDKPPQP